MASNIILNSKAVNKLQVNRLDAQAIRSNNIKSLTPSYIFSSVFNNATFNRNNTGGTLTFFNTDNYSIIQFSDRPFRQTDNITFEEFVSLFDTLGNNSFEQNPPNAVLVHEEEQRTYVLRLTSSDSNSVTFNLELLAGESHNLGDVNGRMSLFVDASGKFAVPSSTRCATCFDLEEAASYFTKNQIYDISLRNSSGKILSQRMKFQTRQVNPNKLIFTGVGTDSETNYNWEGGNGNPVYVIKNYLPPDEWQDVNINIGEVLNLFANPS